MELGGLGYLTSATRHGTGQVGTRFIDPVRMKG